MSFPPHEYMTRGAPKVRLPKITTYGYVVQNVPTGHGKLMQLPLPVEKDLVRPRYNACTVRPERSLSVKQIMAGEYFTRPDVTKYAALLHQERTAAATLQQQRQHQRLQQHHQQQLSGAPAAAPASASMLPRGLPPSQSAPMLSTRRSEADAGGPRATLAPTSSVASLSAIS